MYMGGVFLAEAFKSGCGRPELIKNQEEKNSESVKAVNREENQNMIKVGKPAPTFTAPAFYEGEFTNINLEDYKGKWVLLCFYPGDFTFV